MAFSDSYAIDAAGTVLWPDHKAYYGQGGSSLLDTDGVFEGADVLRACLAERNLILNVSAVLWRRAALIAALDRCAGAIETFKMAGDWRLYAELLAGGGKVAYVAQPLNAHRRHSDSVTHRLATRRHLAEVRQMHLHMRTLLGRQPGLADSQRRALTATKRALRDKQTQP